MPREVSVTHSDDSGHPDAAPRAPTFWQMVGSILASFFGVQNSERRRRDFTFGKARAFLLVGVLMTIVWYGAISLVVHFVLQK
jgi:hypothetical protein